MPCSNPTSLTNIDRLPMEVDASIYGSPKRKRGQATRGPSLVTSGVSHNPSSPFEQQEEFGSHSPSTRVAGKFQKLDLQSPIDLPPLNYSPTQDPEPHQMVGSTNNPDSSLSQAFQPPKATEFQFESPVLQKATLATDHATALSNHAKSPPPSSVVSDQFWHASEITGWSPDDPDEDNYGVNGVGYAKPASKAWAISQKRKQQIADYRSRETREARQRRHERRLSGFNSRRGSPKGSPRPGSRSGDGSDENKSGSAERKGVRFVQFDDG